MSWFRVDDQVAFHSKIIQAGNAAAGAWMRMGAWCGSQLTDGFVPVAVAKTIASAEELERLLAVHLLDAADGGFQVHDYLDRNPSRAQELARRTELSAKRAEAGRKGAESRWEKHGAAALAADGKPDGKRDGKPAAPPEAGKDSRDLDDGKLPPRLPSTPNGPVPVPVPVSDPNPESAHAGGRVQRGNPVPSRPVTKRVTGDPRARAVKGPKAAAARGTNGNSSTTGQTSQEKKTRDEILAGEAPLVRAAFDCLDHGEEIPPLALEALEKACLQRQELRALVHDAQASAPARTGTA